ncbi:nucleoside hydrolase [Streptomyces sp. NPDC048504]|uniref:nucleoside hydrolase n=1 Tax=Streptomyces sp. NPDC048504 TaxID=3365559 RepID=UPI00371BE31E
MPIQDQEHPDLDVIIDCDTGTDDAVELLTAFGIPGVRVLAVTCVDGNVGVDAVVRNTLGVLDAADAPDVPVARGCPVPLAQPTPDASWVHGDNGLGGIALPETSRAAVPLHAVELLRTTLTAADRPVTVVATGPLTNLAVLFTCYPEVKEKIGRIVVMGGSAAVGGNSDATAEFNFFHDPEAAEIVLRTGPNVWLYGLDVFNSVTVPAEQVRKLVEHTEPAARLAGNLLTGMGKTWNRVDPVLGDTGAFLVAVWPELAQVSAHRTTVELHGAYTRGMSVVDRRADEDLPPYTDTSWSAVTVVWSVDEDALRGRLMDALLRPRTRR